MPLWDRTVIVVALRLWFVKFVLNPAFQICFSSYYSMYGSLKEHCHTIFQWSSNFRLVSERRHRTCHLSDSNMISGFSLGSPPSPPCIHFLISFTHIYIGTITFLFHFIVCKFNIFTPPAPFLVTNDSRFNSLSPSLPLLPKWSMRSINTLCCKPTGLSVFKFEVILVISSFSITGLCFVMSLPSTRSVRTWALNMVLHTWKFRSVILFIARLYGRDVKCRWINARMLRIPLVE